eukprot:EG_transcript_17968
MAAPIVPKGFPTFLKGYVGNRHLFSALKPMEATNPVIAQCNSVLNIAPTFKWALSIVPMLGIFQGYPPPEKLDIMQTVALFTTGCVWSFYAIIIRPQYMVTLESLPKDCTAQQIMAAGKEFGVTDAKVVTTSGQSSGVLAFAQEEGAKSILSKGTFSLGGETVKASTQGLNWFNRMLTGSRALFLVNVGLLVVHGWNLRRKYVWLQEEKKKEN